MAALVDDDAIPVPFPGNKMAKGLPGGGWVLKVGRSPVEWPGEAAEGCCGSLFHLSGPWQITCTRGLDHQSQWHVAGTTETHAIAVWRNSS
jgi:hypothetical protein